MFKLNLNDKQLEPLSSKSFGELGVLERFDIQEWIEKSPSILGEDLLIISKELQLSTGLRLDLLSLDREGNLVVIELKRDGSARDVEWQSIKYASYCSNYLPDEIFAIYAQYLESDEDDAQLRIEEFIDAEIDEMNQSQRMILVSQEFHSDVASAVLWLRDHEVDVRCLRLRSYVDKDANLFVTPDVIIPLPEAQDYIQRKEAKQKKLRRPARSSFSLDKGTYELPELEHKIRNTLSRKSDLTPRFVIFLEIILEEERSFDREEVKRKLFDSGIGTDIGHAGRYLSNISQFLTKKSSPHLRQIIEFDTGGERGETKDNYHVIVEYRDLLSKLVSEYKDQQAI